MRINLFIIYLCFVFCRLNSQIQSMYVPKRTNNKINTALIQYHQIQQRQAKVFYYRPINKVKFTFHAGFNSNIISKVNTDTLKSGDFKDAFNDIEVQDATMIAKYDGRMKIYLSKRWRMLFKAQIVGFNNNYYTCGFYWKM